MSDKHTDLPLFSWKPPCVVVMFPLDRQHGRIRDVAAKLSTKRSERHTEQYRSQVTKSVSRNLKFCGVPDQEQQRHLASFWKAVEQETCRLSFESAGKFDPRGAA